MTPEKEGAAEATEFNPSREGLEIKVETDEEAGEAAKEEEEEAQLGAPPARTKLLREEDVNDEAEVKKLEIAPDVPNEGEELLLLLIFELYIMFG